MPEPVPDNESVQFRLLYSGNQLLSNGGPAVKHALRKSFHPQLKHLWFSNPRLVRMASRWGNFKLYGDLILGGESAAREREPIWEKVEGQMARGQGKFLQMAADRYARGKFRFVPLVEEDLRLRVSLDILFLRRDHHPLVKEGGDIDNRLKTLFDALRVPDTSDGLGAEPGEGEEPIFVLLQDDALISEVHVDTDSLLMLPQQKAPDPKDAFLVIDVKILPTEDIERSLCFS
ncbi:MAG TPA: hypothetical protein VG267_12050 [Terracidiphilus sp.]|jgi:hypothetical protein|nr:hypothetical protein [Terracidiphilus sp.]